MKYSSTIRLINIIVFTLLGVGFGFLGVYFGFLVAPFLFVGKGPIDLPEMNFGLPAMLGAFGTAGLLLCIYGLANSVIGLLKEKDDAPVRRSFGAYVGIGYLIAIFFLVNAVWLYRLTSSNIGYDDIAFVITVYVVCFLIAIIVSNIPVLKMYGEKEELNKIMKIIDGAFLAANFSLLLIFGLAFILALNGATIAHADVIQRNLGIATIFFFVACALNLFAFIGYGKADKNGTINKVNGLLFEGGLLVNGASIIVAGVLEYLSQSVSHPASVSLVGKTVPNTNGNYLEFSIMAFIFGGVIVLASLYLCYSTLKGGKAEEKKPLR